MPAGPKLGSALASGGLSELWRRLWFVVLCIAVFRLGAYIPVPGINPIALANLFHQHENGLLGMFNLFSGGAFSRMTLFGLSIMPYISASIIIQMFGSVSPKLQQLKKEGEAGRRKTNQYIRYATLLLSVMQGLGAAKFLVSSNVVPNPNFNFYFTAVVTLVTGTMFLMW
nr:preprotein translocase subunit SecY [Gammaproteobacteria bacterium]